MATNERIGLNTAEHSWINENDDRGNYFQFNAKIKH